MLSALLFFIFKDQTLNVIILRQICCHFFWTCLWNVAWCCNEILWVLFVTIDARNMAVVFNVKIVRYLLRVSHILGRMCNRLLLCLLLLLSILLLHLELLSSNHFLIICIRALGWSKTRAIVLFLRRFALFDYLWFKF